MICEKCQIRYARFKEFQPLCEVCFRKSNGFYRRMIKEYRTFGVTTLPGFNMKIEGWSFAESVQLMMLFTAVLHSPNLNKYPDTRVNYLHKHYTPYQIKRSFAYFRESSQKWIRDAKKLSSYQTGIRRFGNERH